MDTQRTLLLLVRKCQKQCSRCDKNNCLTKRQRLELQECPNVEGLRVVRIVFDIRFAHMHKASALCRVFGEHTGRIQGRICISSRLFSPLPHMARSTYIEPTFSFLSFPCPLPSASLHRACILQKLTGKSMAASISFLDLRFFAFPRRSFLAMTICLFLTTAFTMQFLYMEGRYGCLSLSPFCLCIRTYIHTLR